LVLRFLYAWRRRLASEPQPGRTAPSTARQFGLHSITGVCIFFCALGIGCSHAGAQGPRIEFTRIPPAAEGGPDKLDIIEGRVTDARSQQQLVLYAHNGKWWVQPLVDEPFTQIRKDTGWTNSTHLGTEYAALVVEPGFQPPATLDELPAQGAGVAALAIVKGSEPKAEVSKTLQFSGYEWRIRTAPSDRGGINQYNADNAWTDASGALHLRIVKRSGDWTCAEVSLTRSLGYGTYSFVVRDVSHLQRAAVFGIFTWDYAGGNSSHREMDIEISRWGDPGMKNGQYVIQPYYVPENTTRFTVPAGTVTHSFRWDPGRVVFRTVAGAGGIGKSQAAAEHVFTSGVPSHGAESVRMNLFVYRNATPSLSEETEVVIEKFQFLP
jgi:hypothetical protein